MQDGKTKVMDNILIPPNSNVFIIEPSSVPYIASFAFPIACILLVSGACM